MHNANPNTPAAAHVTVHPAPFTDFAALMQVFKVRFGDHNPAQTAQLKLETLEMGMDLAELYVQEYMRQLVDTMTCLY